jgi:hypothetical protein
MAGTGSGRLGRFPVSPQDTRCWRKTRRRALRGVPTGRRATHEVQTTYGQRQQERDRLAAWLWLTARAEMTADLAGEDRTWTA